MMVLNAKITFTVWIWIVIAIVLKIFIGKNIDSSINTYKI